MQKITPDDKFYSSKVSNIEYCKQMETEALMRKKQKTIKNKVFIHILMY